jgi:hypothetical protein
VFQVDAFLRRQRRGDTFAPTRAAADFPVDGFHPIPAGLQLRDPFPEAGDRFYIIRVNRVVGLSVDFIGAARHTGGLLLMLEAGAHRGIVPLQIAAVMPFAVVTNEDRLARWNAGDGSAGTAKAGGGFLCAFLGPCAQAFRAAGSAFSVGHGLMLLRKGAKPGMKARLALVCPTG